MSRNRRRLANNLNYVLDHHPRVDTFARDVGRAILASGNGRPNIPQFTADHDCTEQSFWEAVEVLQDLEVIDLWADGFIYLCGTAARRHVRELKGNTA